MRFRVTCEAGLRSQNGALEKADTGQGTRSCFLGKAFEYCAVVERGRVGFVSSCGLAFDNGRRAGSLGSQAAADKGMFSLQSCRKKMLIQSKLHSD